MYMYTNLIYATAIYKISTKEISNFFLLPVSVTKKGWESLYFYKKVHKKTIDLFKVTHNSPPPGSILFQA